VLTCSKNQPAAVAFLDFATSPWARFVLKENGYTVP
jgi:ABC-type molybdate transport system substrate-binding protein